MNDDEAIISYGSAFMLETSGTAANEMNVGSSKCGYGEMEISDMAESIFFNSGIGGVVY
jgi:hypothetical protein